MTTRSDDHQDRQFDEMLRDLGPDVPEPALDADARARVLRSLDAAEPRRRRGPLWAAVIGGSLAAGLALACVLLLMRLERAEQRLATSAWETEEVLHLLISARRTQQPTPVPGDLTGLRSDDLVLITFHHDLCPVAGPSTPLFRAMAQRHRDEPARFLTIDVTGPNRDAAARQIETLGLQFALLGPLGAETGTVKVLDPANRRVICSAPGALGLQQAEQVLAAVAKPG